MIARGDRRWVAIFIFVTLVVTTVPYLVGFNRENESWIYSGFVFGVEDGHKYLATMLDGWSGEWLYRSPFTAYPQNGVLAFLPYLLLGKLIASPAIHEQAAALFHIYRWVAVAIDILFTYTFIALFIHHTTWRRFTLALAIFGGGLGWILVGMGTVWFDYLPLDFISPETFGFLGVFGLPHLALARGLLLLGLWVYLLPTEDSKAAIGRRRVLNAGRIAWVCLALIQPVTTLIGWFLMGAHLGFYALLQFGRQRQGSPPQWEEWRSRLKRCLALVAPGAPFVIYITVEYLTDPFLKIWDTQSRTLSPHPAHYGIAYGWIGIWAVLGCITLVRRASFQSGFLMLWVAFLPVLAYAPTNLQRRLPEGVWVALVILAVVGLQRVQRFSRFLQTGVLGFSLISAILLIGGGLLSTNTPSAPLFIPREAVEAYRYFSDQVKPQSVVLTAFRSGNELPAFAPIHVMVGHGPESANGAELIEKIRRFFQPDGNDTERLKLLKDFHVTYILWGPHERDLGSWNPETAEYLRSVYTSPSHSIFRVVYP